MLPGVSRARRKKTGKNKGMLILVSDEEKLEIEKAAAREGVSNESLHRRAGDQSSGKSAGVAGPEQTSESMRLSLVSDGKHSFTSPAAVKEQSPLRRLPGGAATDFVPFPALAFLLNSRNSLGQNEELMKN